MESGYVALEHCSAAWLHVASESMVLASMHGVRPDDQKKHKECSLAAASMVHICYAMCIMLYGIVLHCIMLHCAVLHCMYSAEAVSCVSHIGGLILSLAMHSMCTSSLQLSDCILTLMLDGQVCCALQVLCTDEAAPTSEELCQAHMLLLALLSSCTDLTPSVQLLDALAHHGLAPQGGHAAVTSRDLQGLLFDGALKWAFGSWDLMSAACSVAIECVPVNAKTFLGVPCGSLLLFCNNVLCNAREHVR